MGGGMSKWDEHDIMSPILTPGEKLARGSKRAREEGFRAGYAQALEDAVVSLGIMAKQRLEQVKDTSMWERDYWSFERAKDAVRALQREKI